MVHKHTLNLFLPTLPILKHLKSVGNLLATEPIIPLIIFSFFVSTRILGCEILISFGFLLFLFIAYLTGVKKLAAKNSKQDLGVFIVLSFSASIAISSIANMDLAIIFFLVVTLISGITSLLNSLYPKIITDFLFKAVLFPFLLSFFLFSGLFLMATVNTMPIAVLLCFTILQLINGKKATWILKLIVICVLILAVFGFKQVIMVGVSRAYSIYSDPNNYGTLLIIGTWITFFQCVKAEETKKTAFYLICFFLVVTNLFLTLSRGAIFGFVFSIVVFALLCVFSKIKNTKQATTKAVVLVVLVLLIFAFFIPKMVERGEEGLETRTFIWSTSLKIFLEKPYFGGGRYYLMNRSTELFQNDLNPPPKVYFSSAHNLYLNIAVELGIVGLLVFSFLMFVIFIRLFKSLSDPNLRFLSVCLLSMFSGLMIHGLVDTVLCYQPVQFAFFILVGLALGHTRS